MSAEQNKAVIRRFFDAWNSRRPEAFDDLIMPDVVRHCDATPDVEARSLDQIKEFLAQDTAIFPDSVQTIKLLIAEENYVAAWVTYEGTQQGPMGPLPPSGRKARFDFGAMFRIDDRKIAEWWVTWDNMKILRSLGHLPSGSDRWNPRHRLGGIPARLWRSYEGSALAGMEPKLGHRRICSKRHAKQPPSVS